MRGWQALVVVGGVMLLIGVGLAAIAVLPGTIEDTVAIPAGSEWFYYVEFDLLGGGGVRVEYAETGGRTVDTFVFTQAQYNTYVDGGTTGSLHEASGAATGSFDVSLPGSGKYYVVFDHGNGFESFEQPIRTAITISGITPNFFIAGIVVLVIGAFLEVVGLRRKRKVVPPMPGYAGSMMPPMPPAPPQGVVMFEEPKPPQPPPPEG